MKKILLSTAALVAFTSGSALAADLPPAPLPPPVAYIPPPVYNWSGFYIGINSGGAFGNSNWTDGNNPNGVTSTGDFNSSGFLIGGTAGGNYQVGAGVFGVEGDFDYSTIKGNVTPAAPNFCALNVTAA